MTPGTAIFRMAFELSPIMLTGGLAQQMTGGALPIIVFTEAANFINGLLSGGANIELDFFFAHFQPMPGSTLIDQQIGTYPFANQAVAANATIAQPLQLSMLMRCMARGALGYGTKLLTMMALQQVLAQHNSLGGTYVVVTPAGIYSNGILTALRDVSDARTEQTQNSYQWDFTFPLLTLEQAEQVQGSLMSKLTNQTQLGAGSSWSGAGPAVGNPSSLLAPSVISSAATPAGITAPFI